MSDTYSQSEVEVKSSVCLRLNVNYLQNVIQYRRTTDQKALCDICDSESDDEKQVITFKLSDKD